MITTMVRTLALAICVLVHTEAAGQSVDDELVPPTAAEAADIKTWIPVKCCWSNNCCRKVSPAALAPISRDRYRVAATSQIVDRTGWSRDGNTWRCTCDLIEGRWVVHLRADTRCIVPVPQEY